MDFWSIAFFDLNFVYEETETKKAMGAWKPPMAFAFISNDYSSTGQASFMSAQRHQLPFVVLNKCSTQILFFNVGFFLTNLRGTCQEGSEICSKIWLSRLLPGRITLFGKWFVTRQDSNHCKLSPE